MRNLSKKHLKQIYRKSRIDPLAKFFCAALNNRDDYRKMMDWRWSMCTNVRYMMPGEKIKRGKKMALRHEELVRSVYNLNTGFADLEAAIINATNSFSSFISNFGGRTND